MMRIAAYLSTLALALGMIGALSGQASADEREYASMGRWRIIAVSEGGQFGYCAADTDNSQVTLRIATNGQQWQLGNPYYDNGPVRGQWGFDGWEEETDFAADGDGWATVNVSRSMLAALKSEASFWIELDRGPQVWSLRGSSAALDKAVECARNQGRQRMAGNPDRKPQGDGGQRKGRNQAGGFRQGQVIQPIRGVFCPMKGVILSQTWNNNPVRVSFVNNTRGPVDLFWIDYKSNWVFYATVPAGGRHKQQTYTNHAWVGVQGGDCLEQRDWYVYNQGEVFEWR